MGVPEANLEPSEGGLVVQTDGWVRCDVATCVGDKPGAGRRCVFAEVGDVSFPGSVVHPSRGRAAWPVREGATTARTTRRIFLVLQGECIALIEGEEADRKAWDF